MGAFLPPINERAACANSVIDNLVGVVYDDEKQRFADGEFIHTSMLVSVSLDKTEARTMNTVYQLGRPLPEWEAFCEEEGFDIGGYGLDDEAQAPHTLH